MLALICQFLLSVPISRPLSPPLPSFLRLFQFLFFLSTARMFSRSRGIPIGVWKSSRGIFKRRREDTGKKFVAKLFWPPLLRILSVLVPSLYLFIHLSLREERSGRKSVSSSPSLIVGRFVIVKLSGNNGLYIYFYRFRFARISNRKWIRTPTERRDSKLLPVTCVRVL